MMSIAFNQILSRFLQDMSTFNMFHDAIVGAVSKHFPTVEKIVCEFHGICFCDECCNMYKLNNFSGFLNTCDHDDADCAVACISEKRINQLQLLLKYAEHMEEVEEEKILNEALAGDNYTQAC